MSTAGFHYSLKAWPWLSTCISRFLESTIAAAKSLLSRYSDVQALVAWWLWWLNGLLSQAGTCSRPNFEPQANNTPSIRLRAFAERTTQDFLFSVYVRTSAFERPHQYVRARGKAVRPFLNLLQEQSCSGCFSGRWRAEVFHKLAPWNLGPWQSITERINRRRTNTVVQRSHRQAVTHCHFPQPPRTSQPLAVLPFCT